MVDILNHGGLFDETSGKLRETLGVLAGVEPETLRRIDFISQPRTDAPPPHDNERDAVFTRLVLLALSEASLDRQKRHSTKKTTKATK